MTPTGYTLAKDAETACQKCVFWRRFERLSPYGWCRAHAMRTQADFVCDAWRER